MCKTTYFESTGPLNFNSTKSINQSLDLRCQLTVVVVVVVVVVVDNVVVVVVVVAMDAVAVVTARRR